MARAVRIDAIEQLPGGGVHIGYTTGATPLPASPGGMGFVVTSRADLISKIRAAVEDIADQDMALLLLAYWLKRDGGLDTVSNIVGKTVTIDMAALRNVVQVS